MREDLPDDDPVEPAAREGALAAVLDSVLADADAAGCTPATLYQDFTVRCRIQRIGGEAMNLSEFKRRLAVARAGFVESASSGPGWEQAQAVAAKLPDDLAGLYLLVVKAAMEAAPCPSDASLAEAYGTSSPARARRMLTYLEAHGAIVIRRDLRGAPVIAVPDLAIETAPGEPEIASAQARRRGRG